MPKIQRSSIRIIKPAGGGAYGDVYKATNATGELVAVKLIRRSVADTTFTIEQADALKRVESRYVVKVRSIERLKDPESGELVHAIVMEWIGGRQLEHILHNRLPLDQARRIGLGLIRGLRAIHTAELVHGDLHAGNVLVNDSQVKIIDILYRYTLADQSPRSKERRYQRDRNDLRRMLSDILTNSDIGMDKVDAFSRAMSQTSTLDDIWLSFEEATDPELQIDVGGAVEQALTTIRDKSFVNTEAYALALSADVLDPVVRPLIEAIIASGIANADHRYYLKLLWSRLSEEGQELIGVQLGAAIDREIPDGNWLPHLFMLRALGLSGWSALKKSTRLRLEKAITRDILNGYHDFHGVFPSKAGALGAWANAFFHRFTRQQEVIDNIVAQLKPVWYSQNYIGMQFIPFIAKINPSDENRERLVKAIASGLSNDPYVLRTMLYKLPQDWRDEIKAAQRSDH